MPTVGEQASRRVGVGARPAGLAGALTEQSHRHPERSAGNRLRSLGRQARGWR